MKPIGHAQSSFLNLTAIEGVLTLAGEFVSSFYHTVVSEHYKEALYLYKDGATVTHGSEGAAAILSKVRCEIHF